MKYLKYISALFLLLDSCVEPFQVKVADTQRSIVVDGSITDQPGPYTVQISKSATLSNPYDKTEWIKGAAVSIKDDQGNVEILHEVSPGHYQTAITQGTVGVTYTLQFTTEEGNEYESTPEKLLPVGDFSNLHYQFEQRINPPDEDPNNPQNGFNIFLDADVLPEQEGLVRWRWTGTFEIKAYPELRTKVLPGPIPKFLPDPEKCSGWVVPRGHTAMELVGPCTCCYCWVTQYNTIPLLSESRFINDNKINQYNVAYVPASRKYFFDKYYLEVEQMSVSKNVYNFWRNVAAQVHQSSDLFQTPPPVTGGNIQTLTKGATPAVGVFTASSIKKHSFFISNFDIPYSLPSPDTVKFSCLDVYRYSTTTQPTFW